MTYLLLALATTLAGMIVLFIGRKRLRLSALLLAGVVLILLTAVFDNLIIYSGIVAYDENLISGVKIWLAPIEDFSYTVFALGLVPLIFEALGSKK